MTLSGLPALVCFLLSSSVVWGLLNSHIPIPVRNTNRNTTASDLNSGLEKPLALLAFPPSNHYHSWYWYLLSCIGIIKPFRTISEVFGKSSAEDSVIPCFPESGPAGVQWLALSICKLAPKYKMSTISNSCQKHQIIHFLATWKPSASEYKQKPHYVYGLAISQIPKWLKK